jgi:hypothetical protein
MPTIEVSIYWMWILCSKNDCVVIYSSYAGHMLKATKILLERVYYIEYVLALCYASVGYWWGLCLPVWLVLIRKEGKVNKCTIVLCLNPVYTRASGGFPASVYKQATCNI